MGSNANRGGGMKEDLSPGTSPAPYPLGNAASIEFSLT